MAACVFFDFVKGRACSWVPHMHAACASFPATFLWVSENLKSLLWALALCIRLLLAGLLLLLYSSLPCCYEAARGCARASAREAGSSLEQFQNRPTWLFTHLLEHINERPHSSRAG